MILSNEDYYSKVTTQIERGSLITLSSNITKSFEKQVKNSIKNMQGLLHETLASCIILSNSKPGTMYSLIKTHKENNPARVITSGCGAEFLSISVENYLCKEVNKINIRIKDTSDMLNKTVNINGRNIIANDSVLFLVLVA